MRSRGPSVSKKTWVGDKSFGLMWLEPHDTFTPRHINVAATPRTLCGNIGPNSAFNTALIESGFSPAEVTRILSALNEAGLAVVAMGLGVWED